MRLTWLIVMMAASTSGLGSACAGAEEIALSLVHPKGRIDIPANAVSSVNARATITIHNTATGGSREFPGPHVEVCLSKEIRDRLCQLTQKIVGEPLQIVVDCKAVSQPIVREPLCTNPCFQISAIDLAEATETAKRIQSGTNKLCTPTN
jgi:preprotein translocase subunit SecD